MQFDSPYDYFLSQQALKKPATLNPDFMCETIEYLRKKEVDLIGRESFVAVMKFRKGEFLE